jgi:hypothetical protein
VLNDCLTSGSAGALFAIPIHYKAKWNLQSYLFIQRDIGVTQKE